MKKLIIVSFLLVSLSSLACINEYRTLLSGEVILTFPSDGKLLPREINKDELRNKANKLLKQYQNSDSIEYLSDYAAALIYLGEYDKSKAIYFDIESKKPSLYTTASNLGTLYELINKPDSALFWIKKSMELNPNSHGGSEWIHVKILEFKLNNQQNPDQSILGLNFETAALPANPDNYDLHKIERHIRHQLRERLNFVKAPDKILGNIYFDLGNILAQTSDLEAALESYEAAKEFGFESELLERRIEEFEDITRKARFKETAVGFMKDHIRTIFYSTLAFITLLAGYIIYRVVKRKRKHI